MPVPRQRRDSGKGARIVRQAAILDTLLSIEELPAKPHQATRAEIINQLGGRRMIFMQFAALFVIYAGYLTVMVLLPVSVAAVLGAACVRAIMMRR